MRGDDDARPALDVGWVLPHELHDFVEGRVVQAVDLVVLDRDLASLQRISVDECTEDSVDQNSRSLRHLRQVDVAFQRRLRGKLQDLLCQRCGVVAHALELVRHMVKREQVAQVAGDRLLGRDRDRDQLRDAALGLVDDRITLDHVEGEHRVMADQRPTCLADGGFDQRPHHEDPVADPLFFAIQGLARRRDRDVGRLASIGHRLVDLRVHGVLPSAWIIGHRWRSTINRTGRTRSPQSAGALGS